MIARTSRQRFALAMLLACAATASAAEETTKRSVALKSGITMKYVVAGPESGEPLLLLHGLGDTSRS